MPKQSFQYAGSRIQGIKGAKSQLFCVLCATMIKGFVQIPV